MSLLCDDSTEYINHGSGATIDDVFTGCIMAWVYLTSLPTGSGHAQRILAKGQASVSGEDFLFGTAGGNSLLFSISRATTGALILAGFTNFATQVTTNKWLFIAYNYDATSTTNSNQNVYTGDLSTLAAECTSYTVQQAGSGAGLTNAPNNCYVGNNADATTECLEGRIGWLGWWNARQTLAQIQMQQFFQRVSSGCLLFTHYGFGGTGTQADWSGNGNNGTVTNATLADHFPLGPFFGFDSGHHKAPAAPSGRIFKLAGEGGGLAGIPRGLAAYKVPSFYRVPSL